LNILERIPKEDLLLHLLDLMNIKLIGLLKEMIQHKIFMNVDLIIEELLQIPKIILIWPLLIIVFGLEDSLLQMMKLEIDLWQKWEKKQLNKIKEILYLNKYNKLQL
jgi:hypothetical protein